MRACVSAPSVEANAGVKGEMIFLCITRHETTCRIPVCCFEGRRICRIAPGGVDESRAGGGVEIFLSKVASRGLFKLLLTDCSVYSRLSVALVSFNVVVAFGERVWCQKRGATTVPQQSSRTWSRGRLRWRRALHAVAEGRQRFFHRFNRCSDPSC